VVTIRDVPLAKGDPLLRVIKSVGLYSCLLRPVLDVEQLANPLKLNVLPSDHSRIGEEETVENNLR
jgi:hypothetical protein